MNSPSLGNLYSLIDSKISRICFPFVTEHEVNSEAKGSFSYSGIQHKYSLECNGRVVDW